MRTALALVAVVALSGCGAAAGVSSVAGSKTTSVPPIREALVACSNLLTKNEGDGGHSVHLGTKGSDKVTIEEMACVLNGLDIPDAVVSQIDKTTAMQGVQTATWGEFSAKWTYHPDNGLDIIVTDGTLK
jgi:hypothetical protein